MAGVPQLTLLKVMLLIARILLCFYCRIGIHLCLRNGQYPAITVIWDRSGGQGIIVTAFDLRFRALPIGVAVALKRQNEMPDNLVTTSYYAVTFDQPYQHTDRTRKLPDISTRISNTCN